MLAQLRGASLLVATVSVGLMAGLFYAYACSVMPGLRGLDDRSFVDAMQRINVAILNGWFLLVFVGALLVTAVAVALHVPSGGRRVLGWVIAGLVLYLAMLVITSGVNVPLNNRLAAAGDPAHLADPAAVRGQFEAVWVRWNVARAVTATASFACLAWALWRTARH